jgi:hypothetical protein
MTTPDIAGLCERLRDSVRDTGYMGIERGCQTCSIAGLLNDEAADTLERQAAEIERLRRALRRIRDLDTRTHHDGYDNGPGGGNYIYRDVIFTDEAFPLIDAALTGEDHD